MFVLITRILTLAALVFAVLMFAARARSTLGRAMPADHSPAKGSPQEGTLYAFTLGMAPWAKESTRLHWFAYLRGIGFHVGIFAGLAALLVSPWWGLLPEPILGLAAAVVGLGALLGFAGEIMRRTEHNLKALSTADDHIAVLLVSFFLAATAAAVLAAPLLPAMYISAAIMLVYAPLGKIRHCIYFFFSRRFFGMFVGRRAVVHPAPVEVTR